MTLFCHLYSPCPRLLADPMQECRMRNPQPPPGFTGADLPAPPAFSQFFEPRRARMLRRPILLPTCPGCRDAFGLPLPDEFGPYGSIEETMTVLSRLCENYAIWISTLEERKATLETGMLETADRHISNCKTCLARMRSGVELLKTDRCVQTAFRYMNLAMLQQQLHYNLPLQQWVEDENERLILNSKLERMPDPTYPETWWGNKERYGKF